MNRRAPIARRTPLRRSMRPIPRNPKARGTRTSAHRKARMRLADVADALWSKLVKLPGRCEECGSTRDLTAAHGFRRSYRGTRWLPINGFAQCLYPCHDHFTRHPKEWDARLRELWGPYTYETLAALRSGKPDLKETIAALREELARRTAEAA